MRIKSLSAFSLLIASLHTLAQGTVPTFTHTVGSNTFTLAGSDPAKPGATTIPTVLVPITLAFESKKAALMDAAPDIPHILASPIFWS